MTPAAGYSPPRPFPQLGSAQTPEFMGEALLRGDPHVGTAPGPFSAAFRVAVDFRRSTSQR